MQRSRRKKAWLSVFLLFAALVIVGYIYRYPLVMKFQYWRLNSLSCPEQNYNRKYDCQGKIGAHRVNSLERYDLLRKRFDTFESDLCYEPSVKKFFIYHPPLTSKTAILPLDKFLDKVDLPNHSFWFDTRFVASSNMQEAMDALADLDTMTIKKNCTFEFYDATTAAFFTQRGYHTSFNASEEVQQLMQKNQLVKDSINHILSNVSMVSQDYRYLSVIKQLFPGKAIATWDLRFSSFIWKSRLQQLMNDKRVTFIMVNIKTPYYQ